MDELTVVLTDTALLSRLYVNEGTGKTIEKTPSMRRRQFAASFTKPATS
jgi:hypothetical protein